MPENTVIGDVRLAGVTLEGDEKKKKSAGSPADREYTSGPRQRVREAQELRLHAEMLVACVCYYRWLCGRVASQLTAKRRPEADDFAKVFSQQRLRRHKWNVLATRMSASTAGAHGR